MNFPFISVLISDIIFIAFALGLNKENAKYLLSGYNTMSKKERETDLFLFSAYGVLNYNYDNEEFILSNNNGRDNYTYANTSLTRSAAS